MARSIERRLMQGPKLPDVTGATFFKVKKKKKNNPENHCRSIDFLQVFPFAILLDPQMRIFHLGHSIKNVFPADTVLIGRYLDDVFRLIRPDILVEWNRVS